MNCSANFVEVSWIVVLDFNVDRLRDGRGELASDLGAGAGPYAKVLAEEIIKPGIEAVYMFRRVQVRDEDRGRAHFPRINGKWARRSCRSRHRPTGTAGCR